MKIQDENIFKSSLEQGFNLFIGAGFSLLAKDKIGRTLPTGSQLCEELKLTFNKKGPYDLVQIATILETTKRAEFHNYLKERFSTKEVPNEYKILLDLNIKNIYTTNIDDLLQKLYALSDTKYLNNISENGSSRDDCAVDFSALHGSILNADKPLVFDVASIANTYTNSQRVWDYLSKAIEKYPTIFIGYSLNDNGVIKSLTSSNTFRNAQREKWIVVRKEDEELSEYYQSLGFKIIISDTKELLNYLTINKIETKKKDKLNYDDIKWYFPKDIVPKNANDLRKRPINDFFLGYAPIWSDIFSNQIFKTSHFHKIKDKIFDSKNLIVLGTPASGKSTLSMLVAANTEYDGIKLIFNTLDYQKAQLLTKRLDERKALIFIDNFCDSIESFNYLTRYKNIKLVGFERGHNYGIVSHLINEENYNILNITKLSDADIQGVYDSLPALIRKEVLKRETNGDYEKDSIFELITRNVKSPSLADRFKKALDELEVKAPELAEFLVLCSYFHSTKVPVSFEMAYSYFSDDVESYEVIFEMRDQLGDLLKDYCGDLVIDEDQDYYYPRSIYAADTILRQANPNLLKTVINKVLLNVPSVQICSYNIFRKYAYDKNLISKAFNNWREGMQFYEQAYINDFKNPYVLQQGALYLAGKKQYSEAFTWIDTAINQTNNKYFSIRNSHAIILFDANINSKEESSAIREELDRSMNILEKCITADKRKVFHATRYGDQAISYHTRYYDDKSLLYLKNARTWLREESRKVYYNDVLEVLLKVENAIDN